MTYTYMKNTGFGDMMINLECSQKMVQLFYSKKCNVEYMGSERQVWYKSLNQVCTKPVQKLY